MSLIGLLVAVLVTCVLVWLVREGRVPAPFHWILYAVLVVIWLVILLNVTGMSSHLNIGRVRL